jgi:hypothetical protein
LQKNGIHGAEATQRGNPVLGASRTAVLRVLRLSILLLATIASSALLVQAGASSGGGTLSHHELLDADELDTSEASNDGSPYEALALECSDDETPDDEEPGAAPAVERISSRHRRTCIRVGRRRPRHWSLASECLLASRPARGPPTA